MLEYEIPKWDGGLGQPNVYVPVEAKQAAREGECPSEGLSHAEGKDWFTRDTFMAMLRLRGLECRSPSGYAEAFLWPQASFQGRLKREFPHRPGRSSGRNQRLVCPVPP